jgi:hypothetical protein
MIMKPQFDTLQDNIAPGVYEVMISATEDKISKAGMGYAEWTLETVNELKPANNGRKLRWAGGAEGFMLKRTKDLYVAAVGKDLPAEFDTQELVGLKVQALVVDGVNRQTGELTGYPEVKSVRAISSN